MNVDSNASKTAGYVWRLSAGAIVDATGSYDYAFLVSGSSMALAGIVCLPVRRIAAWENRRAERTKAQQQTTHECWKLDSARKLQFLRAPRGCTLLLLWSERDILPALKGHRKENTSRYVMLYAVQYNCQSQTFRALSDVCALMDAAVWSGGMPAGCSADPVAANERHYALLLNQLMPISMQIPRLYVVTERPCVYRNAAKNPLTRLLPPPRS